MAIPSSFSVFCCFVFCFPENHTEVRDTMALGVPSGPALGSGQGQSSPSDAGSGHYQPCQGCLVTARPGPPAGLGRGGLRPGQAVAAEYGVRGGNEQDPSQKLGS